MTHNTKTREEQEAFVANRKEAGRVIDIETCEVACWDTNYFDPYGIYRGDGGPTEMMQCYWVGSEESDDWIVEHDLPPEKQQAVPRQYKRTLNLWYAARALHPLYEVVADTAWIWEDEIKWKGDGKEPSRGALIEWFKINYPTLASEIEART